MTLHITEFAKIGTITNSDDPQVAAKSLAYQNIVLSGVNQQSAAVNAATKLVRVVATVPAYIVIGANPNATNGHKIFIPANLPEYFAVAAADKIAGVTA
jgi:hypothetical protein